MELLKKETVFEGNYLRFVKKHFKTSKGEYTWEIIERKNVYGRGAVVIVALTEEEELIFERNWRAPLESFVIQFPAGLIDKQGESEQDVARRELLEETGYRADKLIPITAVPLCPALTTTGAIHFFAPDVKLTGKGNEEPTEDIEVLKVPIDEVDNFLLNLPEDTELDLQVPGILWVLERKGMI